MKRFSRLAMVAVLVAVQALAVAPATQRAVRNLGSVFGSVQLLPELRNGPISPDKKQTAENLLRDLDTACTRGERELGGIAPADKGDAEVQALAAKLAEFQAFRADLKKAIEGGAAASAANDKIFRAFREETKPFEPAVKQFRGGPHGTVAAIKGWVDELAKLDALCKSKYPGIADDQRLSFQLAIEPGTWCDIAARRDAIAKKAITDGIAGGLEKIVAEVHEETAALSRNEGFIGEDDRPYKMLKERAATRAELTKQFKGLFDANGETMPADFFAALDKELDLFGAEIDKLATTWPFDATHHDAAAEAGAKKEFARRFPGRSVVKTGMLFANATIDKNPLGIPTERYRTGAILAKRGGKWCEYGKFTAHETYAGGGTYAAPTFTFGAIRFQKCQ